MILFNVGIRDDQTRRLNLYYINGVIGVHKFDDVSNVEKILFLGGIGVG